jgi:hypothetical protein
VGLSIDSVPSVDLWLAVPRAPQRCQEIPVEQVSGGVLARMRPDLGVGAALGPPGGNVGGSGGPGAWQARVA